MISVIIPIYNTVEYLDTCINSIISQTYHDLEILLIDDGSSDGSSEKLDFWASKDSRIHVVHKKENSGASEARNIGLKLAKGDFLSFVDSDDWLEPDYYHVLHGWIEKAGADMALCGYNWIGAERTISVTLINDLVAEVSAEIALSLCIPQKGERKYDLYLWDKLFRKSSITTGNHVPEFNPELSFNEGALWLVSVMIMCKSAVICKECLYNYRSYRRGNTWSSINQFNNLQYCRDALQANKAIWEILKRTASKSENNAFQRILYYQRIAIRTADNVKDKKAYKEYRKGYYSNLLKWYSRNRSFIGLKWLIRQVLSDVVFRVKRMNNRMNGEAANTSGSQRFAKEPAIQEKYLKMLSLKEVQALELEILLEFKRICKEHGLAFSLAGGTMLGAIRHRGFIPWDDDVDVLMPRPDYERFIQLAKKEHNLFPPEYKLYAYELGNAVYPFAKLANQKTHIEEKLCKDECASHICIDVFPADGLPDREVEIEALYKRMKFLRNNLCICWGKNGKGTPARKILKLIIRLLGPDIWCSAIRTLALKKDYGSSQFVGGVVWGLYGVKEKCDRSDYDHIINVTFESHDMPAMSCWKEYLTNLYGDYMELPPEGRRRTHILKAWID